MKKIVWKDLRTLSVWILISVGLALGLRIFIFASFKVPSPSMEPTILAGDYVWVNKLTLGARMYANFDFIRGGKVETKRLPGIRKVKRNDVLVFNPPCNESGQFGFDINTFYIKRCVAIPGDTFYIDNGIYKIKNCPDVLGYYAHQWQFSKEMDENIHSGMTFDCFPFDEFYHWTLKDFGPLYIPRKGDLMEINLQNIKLYHALIEYETGEIIAIRENKVYLNNKRLAFYTFRENYYFMAGDFVFNSGDSRYWGLLPEDHIIGKASVIWQSKDINTGKRRWKRMLKSIK
ncbi:MAG: signal peptidase I [Candidatus Symbiothrix sp.]|jgi:signal peptidase I|nr:signal peptidase I [Candidatus Symbiothrix sp.]